MYGIEPYAYLKDVLEKLPTMTNQQVQELTPLKWMRRQATSRASWTWTPFSSFFTTSFRHAVKIRIVRYYLPEFLKDLYAAVCFRTEIWPAKKNKQNCRMFIEIPRQP